MITRALYVLKTRSDKINSLVKLWRKLLNSVINSILEYFGTKLDLNLKNTWENTTGICKKKKKPILELRETPPISPSGQSLDFILYKSKKRAIKYWHSLKSGRPTFNKIQSSSGQPALYRVSPTASPCATTQIWNPNSQTIKITH